MIIDKQNKVIFLEIPKTGTSFVRHHLYDYVSDDFIISPLLKFRHAPLQVAVNHYNIDVKEFDVYCFARHPEDWLVSEFAEYTTNHLTPFLEGKGGELTRKHVRNRHSYFFGKDPFDLNVHLDMLLTDDAFVPMKRTVELGSMWKPTVQCKEELDPNKLHVHKYEDFQDSIAKLFTAFNKPVPNHTKVVHKTQVKKQIPTRRNRSRINRIFDTDFKEFGYQKRTVMALND